MAKEWAKGWQYAGDKMTVFSATEEKVIEDRQLITGQNPRSDHPIAAKFVGALDRATATA
nr:hypothetical protein [uncultured Dongia sp.]